MAYFLASLNWGEQVCILLTIQSNIFQIIAVSFFFPHNYQSVTYQSFKSSIDTWYLNTTFMNS